MKTCIIIFKHELFKIFTDRNTITSVFIVPIIIVLVTSFLAISDTEADTQTGKVYALNQVLTEQTTNEINIVPVMHQTLEELTQAFDLRPEDVVIQVENKNITIFYNSSNATSVGLSNLCRQLFNDKALDEYMIHSVKDISDMVVVKNLNDTTGSKNSLMISVLPYILVLALYQSVSEYATNMIAVEKEKGIFDKIILTPHAFSDIISGKLLASIICGIMSSLVYMIIVAVFSCITGKDSYGLLSMEIAPVEIFFSVLCLILVSCLFATVSILCSLYAATAKEARSLSFPVYGLIMVSAMTAMLQMGHASYICYAIPIYNVFILLQDILSVGVDYIKVLITILSLAVYVVGTLIAIVRPFNTLNCTEASTTESKTEDNHENN